MRSWLIASSRSLSRKAGLLAMTVLQINITCTVIASVAKQPHSPCTTLIHCERSEAIYSTDNKTNPQFPNIFTP